MDTAVLEETEELWIRRCQRGERDAFEPLVRRYGPRAVRFAAGMVRDEDAAQDLSQEAFIRAYRAIRSFDPRRPFYPWFHQILRRICLDHLRRHRRTHSLGELQHVLAATDGRDLERLREREELGRRVRAAMELLPERDREILVLREFQELSYAEIATLIGIPRGTVMSRLYYARRRLRDELNRLLGRDAVPSPDATQQRNDDHEM